MSRLPETWSEVYERLSWLFGGGDGGNAVAVEWVRQALVAKYGVQDPSGLQRQRRAFALQKTLGVLFALEELPGPGDFAFRLGVRADVAAAFARYFDGAVLDGPPWRLDPSETDRPPYETWLASADFGVCSAA